jgi:hypothetical protein
VDCVAVGSYEDNSGNSDNLVEAWDGTTWSVITVPDVSVDDDLDSISCPLAFYCAVVGTAQSNAEALAWDGANWTVTSDANFEGGAGVSCLSATDCVAVGTLNPETIPTSVVDTWDGTHWALTPNPNPDNLGDELFGVSCDQPDDCVAVGTAILGTQHGTATLVESWDGTTWSVTPSTGELKYNFLYGVSCADSTDCVAVGDTHGQPVSSTATLIETGSEQPSSGTPEVPVPLLLPVAGMGIIGAAYAARRRSLARSVSMVASTHADRGVIRSESRESLHDGSEGISTFRGHPYLS